MTFYGYAGVSTLDQDHTIQRAALKAAGCTFVRAEKASGSRRIGRTELQVLLEIMIYCADELGLPADPLGLGLDTKSYLRAAYHDIPMVVPGTVDY